MKIKSLLICACVGAAAVFSSCNKDYEYEKTFVDFVTLETFSDAGATMTFRQKDDSPLITLTSNQKFPATTFKAGTRIVISYIPANGLQYVSGPVTIQEAITTDGLGYQAETATAEETDNWATDPVSIKTINRSGDYIDFTFVASTSLKGKTIEMVLDETTQYDEIPQYHLIFKPNTESAVNQYYFYCSYSVSDTWNDPNVKGIRLNYKDVTLGDHYIDFNKE